MTLQEAITELPEGYFIIDSEVEPHDGDEDDGRYGLYRGDFDFLGVSHDLSEIVYLAKLMVEEGH